MNEKKITSLLVVSDKDYNKKNKILKGIIHIHFLLKMELNDIERKKLRLYQVFIFYRNIIIFLTYFQ